MEFLYPLVSDYEMHNICGGVTVLPSVFQSLLAVCFSPVCSPYVQPVKGPKIS
jgi:hypothetical protein